MTLLTIEEPGKTLSPHQEKDEIAIGIDLGTTNSLVAIKKDDKVIIIPDSEGNLIQPSIIGFGADGLVKCGNEAVKDESLTKVFSIKRLINENSLRDGQIIKNFPHKVVKNNKGDTLKIAINSKLLTPTEISSYLLRHLKEIAENYLGKSVKKAVITVPAYFDEAARLATKNAAILANLEVLRLISEPTSAAIAYGLDNEDKNSNENAKNLFAVFDLGGGTFDISILKLNQGVFKVIGVGGNSVMGGDDIDHMILDKIKKQNHITNLALKNKQKLRLIAKEIKEKFSTQGKIEQNFQISDKNYHFSLNKSEFNQIIGDFVDKTIKITTNLISELELEEDQIEAVVMVGGSTRISLIQEKLAEIFGKSKILTNINPDEIVAIGAAIQAHGLVFGSSNLLLDVVPLSLGLETMGGIVEKIIERNSVIPTSYSKEFTTYADNQTGMKLHILQGERELAADCRSLAQFEIKNIPPLKAGVARVLVNFTIDADGLLTVSAKEQLTGQIQTIEVKPTFGLSVLEMKEMLINSAKNAKSDMQKRLLLEGKSEAQRNILAIQSALKEDGELLSKDEITAIQNQIKNLEEVLQKDDKEKIEIEAEKLEDLARNFAEIKMNKYIKSSLINKKIEEI